MDTLTRVKTTAYNEIRLLRLPEVTEQDVINCIQKAIHKEYRNVGNGGSVPDERHVYSLSFNHECL